MKWDEFAFVNQQLAAMLRDGIPLEGALRRLSATMARGELRVELENLRSALEKGAPLGEALAAGKLPPLYVQMVLIGVKSNNLPGVLTLIADYYQRSNLIWTRLKGLMVYPAIVLVVSLALSLILVFVGRYLLLAWGDTSADLLDGRARPALTEFMLRVGPVGMWLPVCLISLLVVGGLVLSMVPQFRWWLRWRLPGSREACLWQIAAAMTMMLEQGCSLNDTLDWIARLEGPSPAGRDLAEWRERLASGRGSFMDLAKPSGCFPPLFIWLAASGGNDLVLGLRRAAEIYRARAEYRTELLLQGALPTSVLILGTVIFVQVATLAHYILGQLLPLISMW